MARGVCDIDGDGKLVSVTERTTIVKRGENAAYTEDDGKSYTDLAGAVSYTHLDVYKRQVVVIAGIFSAIYKPENGMLNSIIGLFHKMENPILWKGESLSLIHI